MSAYLVSETRTIAAPAQQLFDIVADPGRHPEIDGSGSVRAVRGGGPQRLSLGAKFGMDMHLGANYKIENTVVEFEEGRQLAWRHFNGHVWRYTFTPVDGGTEVTEQWDARPLPIWNRVGLQLTRFPTRNRRGIEKTLDRLAEIATGSHPA
ncbi:SRPBCC family protein [uncultured Jatrophihabitans sp.]|uniref:SRPBCC family protein n=1 Tax=uncultured Jatrophihabitans sp. TaxID=1610747 RepID=UPI0035C9C5EA